MPETLLPQSSVHVGVWTEISPEDGKSTRTLTTSNHDMFVFVAVLALLIAYVGERSWKIMRMILYFSRGTVEEHRSMEDQKKIFIESYAPFDTCIKYIRFYFKNRHPGLPWVEVLFAIFVILSAVGFAGGFLFFAAYFPKPFTHNRVRLQPTSDCGYGYLNLSKIEQLDTLNTLPDQAELYSQLNQLAEFAVNGSFLASSYVDACYGDDAVNDSCDLMFTKRISWNAMNNASCPFTQGQCVGGENSSYTLDTGDVRFASLGVNIKSTLSFRKKTTCSPIVMDPYRVDSEGGVGGIYSHLMYRGRNITETIRNDVAAAYQVNAWMPRIGTQVHPNLQPKVGNVSIVYINRNNLVHLYPTSQPVFSATENITLFGGYTAYTPSWEHRLGAIGCVETLQMCRQNAKSDQKECSNWVGVVRGEDNWTGLDDFYDKSDETEKGLMELLLPAHSVLQTIADAARGSGANLVASRSLINLPLEESMLTELQTSDEPEQWKREVKQWFNVVLSVIQLAGLYFPTVPPFLDKSLMVNELKKESRFICSSIKINSLQYSSINFDAVIAILASSALLITISFMDRVLAHFPWGRGVRMAFRMWRDYHRVAPNIQHGDVENQAGQRMHLLNNGP
ncbi:hypothetical protein B0J14DRAFT_664807 [Halenospora varia]|nr:hypothetical protein B0J14DRAFT_664807 [Halenospora varia]